MAAVMMISIVAVVLSATIAFAEENVEAKATTPLTEDMFELTDSVCEYTGYQIKPGIQYRGVTKNDCIIEYGTNVNIGRGTVRFTGRGKYTGTIVKEFRIIKAENEITSFTVRGGAISASQMYSWNIKSRFGAKQSIIYFSRSANGSYSAVEPGSSGIYYAKAYIPGTVNYDGVWSRPVKFTILPAPTTIRNTISNTVATPKNMWVIYDNVPLATNYVVAYKHRNSQTWVTKNVGKVSRVKISGFSIRGLYEIKVKARKAGTSSEPAIEGAYSTPVYRYFFTVQKIRLASRSKGNFTMSWASDPEATGYQVMYSTNANGAGAANNISTLGRGVTSFTKTGLKSGTTYYVQVRALKKVGDKTYVGNISKPVPVVVK